MQINENEWWDAAARLAKRLHQKQVDKAGFDYFEGHLSTVAKMAKTWQEHVVGYLHDASEDTTHSVDEVITLLEKECNKSLSAAERATISTALTLLNHHSAPNRDYYIKAIAQNALATAVKLNDLTHNMDISRLPRPTSKDYARMERYKAEYTFLQNHGTHYK